MLRLTLDWRFRKPLSLMQHRKGGNPMRTPTSQTAALAGQQRGRRFQAPTLDSSAHLCHLTHTTGATSVSLSLLSNGSAARTDESQQVPLGRHMEQGRRRNPKARTCFLRSTVAEKDKPEGRVHVVAAIPHSPVLPGLVRLCLCSNRMESRVGGTQRPCVSGPSSSQSFFNKLLVLYCLLGPGSQIT